MGFKLNSSENVSILCKTERDINKCFNNWAVWSRDGRSFRRVNKKVVSKAGYTRRGKAHKQNPAWIIKYLPKADSAYFGHVALLPVVTLKKGLTRFKMLRCAACCPRHVWRV